MVGDEAGSQRVYTLATADRPYRKRAGMEPLPGYRLIAPLGRGGFGEVWKCEAPGGLHKAVKFVADDNDPDDVRVGLSSFTGYGAAATFDCSAGSCSPAP